MQTSNGTADVNHHPPAPQHPSAHQETARQPARPLRADARRNRARVLDAAREAFADEGLAVPLDEIARRAGVGAGTVYRHFPTKEALFEAVIVDRLEALVDLGRAALARLDQSPPTVPAAPDPCPTSATPPTHTPIITTTTGPLPPAPTHAPPANEPSASIARGTPVSPAAPPTSVSPRPTSALTTPSPALTPTPDPGAYARTPVAPPALVPNSSPSPTPPAPPTPADSVITAPTSPTLTTPGAEFFRFMTELVVDARAKTDLAEALIGAGVDLRQATLIAAGDLKQVLGELLAHAQGTGAVRPDVDAADLHALVAGAIAAERRAEEDDRPGRMTQIIWDGLRPAGL